MGGVTALESWVQNGSCRSHMQADTETVT